jgi:gamma-glutamylputrescine oxidase
MPPSDDRSGYPPSYYAATAVAAPAADPLEGDVRSAVCIVGGGYAGLSAALRLAEHGVPVTLLESGPVGWGASGRNGGQVHVGMRRDQRWLEKRVGADDARKLWRLALDARDHLDRLMTEYGIDCDYRAGMLHGDHRRRYVAATRRHVAYLRDRYGYTSLRVVERDEIRAMVDTLDYHGGSLDTRGGHLHPLNLVLGIARAATAAGATIHPGSAATHIARHGAGWRVKTARGSVTADTVLLACGGYLEGLNRKVNAHVMPINNYIATTEPLGAERVEALVGSGVAVSDSRSVLYYYRITPDHRLLFGGGESYSLRFPRDIAAFVRPHMERVFPQLRGVGIDYAWGGTLSVTPTRLPYVRHLAPGLYNASGFSGLGVLLAPYFGRILGDAIAGDGGSLDAVSRLPVPPFPGGRWLRWPILAAAMTMFAIRDRL